jgi:hypothetical protein
MVKNLVWKLERDRNRLSNTCLVVNPTIRLCKIPSGFMYPQIRSNGELLRALDESSDLV